MEFPSGKESCEKEVEGERMTEEEFKNQRNRFGLVVIFNDQLYIGPLNNEMNAMEWLLRHYIQQHKRLDKKLSESYVENRNLRDTLKTLQEKLRSSPGADPASNESPHRHITRLPNTNSCGETWDDVLASLNQYSNVAKSTEQAPASQQSDVGRQSMDHQMVTEQNQVLTDSLVCVSLAYLLFMSFPSQQTLSTLLHSLNHIHSFSSLHSLSSSSPETVFTFSSFERCSGGGRVEWTDSSRHGTRGH